MSAQTVKIAFVLASAAVGGTELQAQALVRALRARGLHVDVFLVDGSSGLGDFGEGRVTVLSGRSRGGLGSVAQAVEAFVRLRKEVRAGRYQVVHAAMARAYVLAPLAVTGSPRPRVVAWRRNIGGHLKGSKVALAAERFAARRTDVILANSHVVADYWRDLLGDDSAEIKVVSNALESKWFEVVGDVIPREPGRLRVVSVGGLKAVKAHVHLVGAMARVQALGLPVELVILGEGDERERILAAATEGGLRLVLPGRVDDPRPWLLSADLYAHSSLSEGTSNAIAEAMAARLPIVATDVGGTREMLDGVGVLVPPGDVEALGEAIRALLTGDASIQGMGERAGSRARELFGIDRVVDEHLAAYFPKEHRACAAS